jgi:hypothetical protein
MNVSNKVLTMVKLQLRANLQYDVLGRVEPDLMAQINELASTFDMFDHITVMMALEGHYGEVEVMVHTS